MDIPIRNIVPISQFKSGLSDYARTVHETGEPLVITQNGSPSMVVMSVSEFDDMTKLIQAMKLFNVQRQAEQQYGQGQGVDEATAMARMRALRGRV